MIQAKYVHTNLIAKDWQKLVDFYEQVFGCVKLEPKRKLSGEIFEQGTAVPNAKLEGMHLQLPGYNNQGPTLEIFQYSKYIEKDQPKANKLGFGHIAFEVNDLEQAITEVINNGGKKLSELTTLQIEAKGQISFIYVLDPEDNIIELQSLK